MIGGRVLTVFMVLAVIASALLFISPAASATVPSAYDISTQPYFPKIGNQGGQGSCAAWAITYYAFGYLEAKKNNWTDAHLGTNLSQLMSPAWTYNRVHGEYAFSTMSDNALVLFNLGGATMATMPYNASDGSSLGSPAAFTEAPYHKAATVTQLAYSPSTSIAHLKTLISSDIPVTFGLDYGCFMGHIYSYDRPADDLIIVASEYNASHWPNHAGTFVGYNDSMTYPGEPDVGAFKVANSYGPTFAGTGFFWISYDTVKEIGQTDLMLTYVTVNGTVVQQPPAGEDDGGDDDDDGGSTTPPSSGGSASGGGSSSSTHHATASSRGVIGTTPAKRSTAVIIAAAVTAIVAVAAVLILINGNGKRSRRK